ncbi:EamA family transporter RarD [Fulvimarina sp. 2208YS6-2-32]|uniref:EamA family transporter RarD n=1 Tax=Fulvimarina uroteuthidis TaxID=3098149 RepID=A0ABU5I531_9HYPH|nr:EamA family transporter RarD [Fulvimarina sp. 2208YS6-2-32]MDY8110482.1 EamA family transporter RarD [Fulvimarina sp. 2208YS6-2-32]
MQTSETDTRRGLFLALGAYAIWGLVLPLYMKALNHVSPLEIVAHRIIWALPFAALILVHQGRLAHTLRYFGHLRTLSLAALTAVLISINWGVYVYAIVSNQAIDAALGYYINPLLNVALGAIFLRERPSRLQGVAIALAVVGVAIMTIKAGGLPWIALVLATTFGTYGLLRKLVKVDASEGFFLEVAILFPIAIGTLAFVTDVHFGAIPYETVMLVIAGPLTAIPLILFAAGARLLDFATVGILQYTVPTMLFLTAVFLFGEPFGFWQLVAFAFIWSALVLYAVTLIRQAREERRRRRGASTQGGAQFPDPKTDA